MGGYDDAAGKFTAAWANLEKSYPGTLTSDERLLWDVLEKHRQVAFRVCRTLALYAKHPK